MKRKEIENKLKCLLGHGWSESANYSHDFLVKKIFCFWAKVIINKDLTLGITLDDGRTYAYLGFNHYDEIYDDLPSAIDDAIVDLLKAMYHEAYIKKRIQEH